LADQLVEPDLFWLADEYLYVPTSVLPEVPAGEAETWYAEALAKWEAESSVTTVSFGDFTEIRQCVRHATFGPAARRPDVPFWIDLLDQLRANPDPPQLGRHAAYEIAVASLRGLGTLAGRGELLREYFARIDETADPAWARDVEVLLMYCSTAARRGLADLGEQELAAWLEGLENRLRGLLDASTTPELRSVYTELLGFAAMNPSRSRGPDAGASIGYWLEALSGAEEAPLFPIDSLAASVAQIASVLVDSPRYRDLTAALDEATARRGSASAAAALCRDRAMNLFKAERYVEAVSEFHKAKIGWFSGDTVRGSLLAMVFIAQCYERLHLHVAAKYYYLAMAFAAGRGDGLNDADLLAVGVLSAARIAYMLGEWVEFVDLSCVGMKLHAEFVPDGTDPEKHEILAEMLFNQAVVLGVGQVLVPSLVAHIRSAYEQAGTARAVQDYLAQDPWGSPNKAPDQVVDEVSRQLVGGAGPFSDVGPVRELGWSALGLAHTVRWPNTYAASVAADRFIAVAQVALCDLARSDLAMPPTRLRIDVDVARGTDYTVTPVPANQERRWSIRLPSALARSGVNPRRAHGEAVGVVMSVLRDASLLDDGEFGHTLEDALTEGFVDKATPANAYDVIYASFIDESTFDAMPRAATTPVVDIPPPKCEEHPQLAWRSGPGPTYSLAEANTFLERRYERFTTLLPHTLSRLRTTPEFRETIGRLHRAGWKDWQVLGAVCSAAWGYRSVAHARRTGISLENAHHIYVNRQETVEMEEVPLEVFSMAALLDGEPVSVLASVEAWDLQCRQQTPNIPGIMIFMASRYSHWFDDIDHADLLADEDRP
jgi:hypothetical protein